MGAVDTIAAGVKRGSKYAGFHKYAGAVAVGTQVIFTPCCQDNIGIYDVDTASFRKVDIGENKCDSYMKGVVVGTKVIMGPGAYNKVGVYEVDTGRFRSILIPDLPTTKTRGKYRDGVRAGTKVIFVPLYEPRVGIFEVNTETFRLIDTATDVGYNMYGGGVLAGTQVIFTPSVGYRIHGAWAPYPGRPYPALDSTVDLNIGIYEVDTDTFRTVDAAATDQEGYKASGVLMGTQVVFIPRLGPSVGIYNVDTETITTVDTTAAGGSPFGDAAALVGTQVIFEPGDAGRVGIYQAGGDQCTKPQ